MDLCANNVFQEGSIEEKKTRACSPHPFSSPFHPLVRSHSHSPFLSWRRLGDRRRRPTPGAQAFVGTIAGDEHPPGMRTSCLPFQLRETEHTNPNLSYLACLQLDLIQLQVHTRIMPTNFDFLQKKKIGCVCVHSCHLLGSLLTPSNRVCIQSEMSSVGRSNGTRAANGAAAISTSTTEAGSADARFHSQLLHQDRVHTLHGSLFPGRMQSDLCFSCSFCLTRFRYVHDRIGTGIFSRPWRPRLAIWPSLCLLSTNCTALQAAVVTRYSLKLGIFTSNNLASEVLYIYAPLLLSDNLFSWIFLLLVVMHTFCTPYIFFQCQSTVLVLQYHSSREYMY
jgi:hypothetical protein